MFGLAVARQDWLTGEDQWVLNASTCGLCHSLRQTFGPLAAAFTNYEARFLSILMVAQRGTIASLGRTKCPASAFLKELPTLGNEDACGFAAAVTILLVGERLRDAVRDDNHLLSRILLHLLKTRMAEAHQTLASMSFPCEVLEKARRAQHLVEASHRADLRACLEPTALVVGKAFAHTAMLTDAPANASVLEDLGQAVGRIVALVDACQDLRRDRRTGSHNPISASWSLHDQDFVPVAALAEICTIMTEQLHTIAICMEKLSLPSLDRLVENILTGGIPLRVLQALAVLWGENHWIGSIPPTAPSLCQQAPCPTCGIPHRAQPAARSSRDTDDRIRTLSQNLWVVSSMWPSSSKLAQDLGFADRRAYLLACVLPLIATG